MCYTNKWIVIGMFFIAGMLFSACQGAHKAHHAEHPAKVEAIEGSALKRLTLTEKAIERIDLRTEQVREEMIASSPPKLRKVVPYSALIYDPQGKTWIYTSPQPRTFVRVLIDIDRIEGDTVILNNGPAVGTVIASVGVAELYGTEFEVGH